MVLPRKSMGQHWLTDDKTLRTICASAQLEPEDTVLEIGPGQGSLTRHLLKSAKKVVAVELDESLAGALPGAVKAENLEVVNQDILRFDFTKLPVGYKVVANIPYYLTSHLLRRLIESPNPPAAMTLLVQKEVAERICAKPGQMSILAVSVQLYYRCDLGQIVSARLFTPPPKVDSQIVILKRRRAALFPGLNTTKFFQIVKAGFAERRKKLRSSLAGGLHLSKGQADELLNEAVIGGGLRAQDLNLQDWHKIYKLLD